MNEKTQIEKYGKVKKVGITSGCKRNNKDATGIIRLKYLEFVSFSKFLLVILHIALNLSS